MSIQLRQFVSSVLAASTAFMGPLACSSDAPAGGGGRTQHIEQKWPSTSVTGSGVSRSKTRNARNFHALRVEGSVETYVTVGSAWKLSVTCDDNLVSLIDTSVENGVLVVSQSANLLPRVHCSVDVAMPALTAVDAVGAAHVDIEGKAQGLQRVISEGSGNLSVEEVAGSALQVVSTSSGNIHLGRVAERTMDIDLRGSGGFQAAGTSKEVLIRTAGSGGIIADEVAAEQVDVTSNGSGNISVRASRKARVRVGSSGNVHVAGEPATRDTSSSGTGNITFE